MPAARRSRRRSSRSSCAAWRCSAWTRSTCRSSGGGGSGTASRRTSGRATSGCIARRSRSRRSTPALDAIVAGRGPRPLDRAGRRLGPVELAPELRERPLEPAPGVLGRLVRERVRRDASSRVRTPSWTRRARSTSAANERPAPRRTRGRHGRRGPAPRRRVTQRDQGGGGRDPVERVAVAEERDVALLEEVAGEQDVRAGHVDDDVVVGVAAAEVARARRADRRPRWSRARANVRSGGSMTTSRRSSARAGSSRAIRSRRCSPVRSMNVTQPSWPQIVAGRKTRLP